MSNILKNRQSGFTLLELVVVIGIIAMLAVTALPSIVAVFNSGQDAQAYNIVVAALTTARAEAIRRHTYTLVHFQMAIAERPKKDGSGVWRWSYKDSAGNWNRPKGGIYYVAIGYYDPGRWKFDEPPKLIPGTIIFADADRNTFIDGTTGNFKQLTPADDTTMAQDSDSVSYSGDGCFTGSFIDFTSFNVIFSPTGSVLKKINNVNINIYNGNPNLFSGNNCSLFTDGDPQSPPDNVHSTRVGAIWWNRVVTVGNLPTGTAPGTTVFTMFDYAQYKKVQGSVNRLNWIRENGQRIGMNIYTGQPFPRR